MEAPGETLLVNVKVEITAKTLETFVENLKQMTGRNEKGHYRIDTADKLGEMISRFLFEKDFEGYVRDGMLNSE